MTTVKTGPLAHPLSTAKYALLGLGTVLFLLFMIRKLRRREEEVIPGDPTWLREIQTAIPLSELENQTTTLLPAILTPRDELEKLALAEPEVVAQQVHAWMADG